MSKKILITGSNGQLGQCLKKQADNFTAFQYFFASKNELDIADKVALKTLFQKENFAYCINTAAYTNVEKAESESEKAFVINSEAVQHLAEICKEFDVVLIHISTDYVFDGKKRTPYTEEDPTNPLNVYGQSKLDGEKHIQNSWHKHFIFRTSWLYSQYGHNFYNSILRMAKERKELTITTEQTGTPTNANDLAQAILKIIEQENEEYGVYHFSNSGETTWYGFAKAILKQTNKLNSVNLVETNHYPTFAQRPEYSVLDLKKIKNKLNVVFKDWNESLKTIKKVE